MTPFDIISRTSNPHPPTPSSIGALGPLCGAVEKGEYYWSSLAKALEACPEEASGNQWLTVVLGAVAVVLAAVVYTFRKAADGLLTRCAGTWYTTPAGVVSFTFANGRFKVLWTTFSILTSISWTMNIEFPYPFNQFLNFLAFIQLDFLDTISASCIDASLGIYSNIVLITSLIPVALAALILLTYLVRIAAIGRGTPEKATARAEASQQHA